MKVVIIGGKGTAIVIADQIYDAHVRFGMDIEVIGLALDDRTMGNEIYGYPILCGIHEVYDRFKDDDDVKFIYSLYRNDQIRERTKLLYDLNIPEKKWCNFIHPSALVARSVKMGYGNVVLANCVINAGTVVGNFNTLNSGTLLGHDIKVGNNNFFAAQVTVGSLLEIGDMNFFGLNTTIKTGIRLGEAILVGQASNVTHSFEKDETIFGNPAMSHGATKKKENKKF
jgi:sugar O-acyltransferase (sialic acid O-acetyltransferase NeuD family)